MLQPIEQSPAQQVRPYAYNVADMNRVLQQLRHDGLITLEGRVLTVVDEDRLTAFADFDPNYLHLTRRA